jgi:hypothetical protein
MAIIVSEPTWPLKTQYATVWNKVKTEAGNNYQEAVIKYAREVYHRLRMEGYAEQVANAFIDCATTLAFDDQEYPFPAAEAVSSFGAAFIQEREKYFDANTLVTVDSISSKYIPYQDIEANSWKQILCVYRLLLTDESMQPVTVDQSLPELVKGITDAKFAAYTGQIIEQLKGRDTLVLPDDLGLKNFWEEFVYQLQTGSEYSFDSYVAIVQDACSKLLHSLSVAEQRLLWLQLYSGDNHCPESISSPDDGEDFNIQEDLTNELYQHVCEETDDYDLGLDEEKADNAEEEDGEEVVGDKEKEIAYSDADTPNYFVEILDELRAGLQNEDGGELARQYGLDSCWDVLCLLEQSSEDLHDPDFNREQIKYECITAVNTVANRYNMSDEDLLTQLDPDQVEYVNDETGEYDENLLYNDLQKIILSEVRNYESVAVKDALRLVNYQPVLRVQDAPEALVECVDGIIQALQRDCSITYGEKLGLDNDWEFICYQVQTQPLPEWPECQATILDLLEDQAEELREENECEEEEFLDKMTAGLPKDADEDAPDTYDGKGKFLQAKVMTAVLKQAVAYSSQKLSKALPTV